MATPTSRSMNRLSAIFSPNRDDAALRDVSPSGQNLPPRSPSQGRETVSRKPVPIKQYPSMPNFAPNAGHPAPLQTSLTPQSAAPYDSPLLPPPSLADLSSGRSGSPTGGRPDSRDGSRNGGSRPTTPLAVPGTGSRNGSRPGTPLTPGSSKPKRRSWLPSRSHGGSADMGQTALKAWIAGLDQTIPYDLEPLVNAQKIPELWDDNGDTFVYLFPKSAGKGPSFKIESSLIAGSRNLTFLARTGSQNSRQFGRNRRSMEVRSPDGAINRTSLGVPGSPEMSPRGRAASDASSAASFRLQAVLDDEENQELHLYLPIPFEGDVSSPTPSPRGNDVEILVLYRNFFAFLIGHSLVSTPPHSSLFSIFMGISSLLQRFEFSNLDGSSFGEVAEGSFARYCSELKLGDVRTSREKTVEAIVLGERMKFWNLFNEGFVHGAGKLDDVKAMDSPKFTLISPVTRNRLERAWLDLDGRLHTVRLRLEDFDFPSMFAGIANSSTATESKIIRFKAWKNSFLNFRKHVIAHYRHRFGSWPPKASSKKNNFGESGLHHLVLLDVYQDFADMYDLLVDRTSLTTRTTDSLHSTEDPQDQSDPEESTIRALRRIMGEFDRSTPPVQPPIPFDTPMLPNLTSIKPNYHPLRDAKERSKRVKDEEVNRLLYDAYNKDNLKVTPFLEDFMRHERRQNHGKSIDDMLDNRNGQWLFMYAVLQSLPMVVVDAPDIQYTKGVEYFLCEPPRGGAPWSKEDGARARTYYEVAGGAGVVALPSDHIAHSVEGIYQRSHCWQAAHQWLPTSATDISPARPDRYPPPLQPPTSIVRGLSPQIPPSISPGISPIQSPRVSPGLLPVEGTPSMVDYDRQQRRSSAALGLEALPLPKGVSPDGRDPRPAAKIDPNKTFDSILAGVEQKKKKK